MKKLICKIFGHKWDKSNKYIQPCKRCDRIRVAMYSHYKSMIGKKSISWEILDIPK